MIRAVLVGWSEQQWKLYRQAQWMAEVRRSPEATQRTRHHFDIEEDRFRDVLDAWDREGAGTALVAATALLKRYGAVEITGP